MYGCPCVVIVTNNSLSWMLMTVYICCVCYTWRKVIENHWSGHTCWCALTVTSPLTHSSRIRTTSVRFSYTSCNLTMLACCSCCRMFTSRSISSSRTPRELAILWRFLMNLAAKCTPVCFSVHCLTIANWPLWTREREREQLMREHWCPHCWEHTVGSCRH